MTFRFEGDARRRFDDQAIDAVALTGIFKENPCLFIVAEPSGDSHDRGYGGFVWVVGVAFKDLGYASIEDFLEYLRNAPEPADRLRGRVREEPFSHESRL